MKTKIKTKIKITIIGFLILLFFNIFLIADAKSLSNLEIRCRYEYFNYFNNNPNYDNSYGFLGINLKYNFLMNIDNNNYGLTLIVPYLSNLPKNAVSNVGALGLGGTYYQFSHKQNSNFIIKQAFADFNLYKKKFKINETEFTKDIRFKLGRFDFNDGNEVLPSNTTLKWLRLNRIQQRLICTSEFSHIRRSFEGFNLYVNNFSNYNKSNITLFFGRPTFGIFDIKTPNEHINNLSIGYLSYNLINEKQLSDLRIFYGYYNDRRNLLKTSNNSIPIRDSIYINSIGFNYSKVFENNSGNFDFVLYYVYQFGKWGNLNHNANAYLIDLGYKFKVSIEPYFRIGYFRSSGDKNPNDNKHNTFTPYLYSSRLYAYFPFYNEMNISDFNIYLNLKFSKKISLALDYHDLNLTEDKDRWYAGGGAFNESVFGYTAINNSNLSKLATLYNITLSYNINENSNLNIYYGIANGKDIVKNVFNLKSNANYFFVEYNQKIDFIK
ncbi:MAG: alginate export family protein [bacterium]